MSEGATIKIDGDASGFIAATEESRKAASGMSEPLQGAVGGSSREASKGLKSMDQEGMQEAECESYQYEFRHYGGRVRH